LLAKVTEASDDELPSLLGGISEWCWPRGDLHYWIHILNRFDSILEETCRDYDLHKLQINEFTPLRKRIVVSILKFSRLLIENCTSRKLYSSYEVSTNAIFKRAVDMCRC
jgi:E3 ubiquitin-protein ligase HUWE1